MNVAIVKTAQAKIIEPASSVHTYTSFLDNKESNGISGTVYFVKHIPTSAEGA